MKRFDAYIGALESALQKTPEVLKAICVNLSIHVGNGMVNHLVVIISNESLVGRQSISEQRGSGRYVLSHFGLEWLLLAACNNLCMDSSAPFRKTQHRSLSLFALRHPFLCRQTTMHILR